MSARVKAFSIAGFDPSAGAGLLTDIKTMEQAKVYGLGICTANTIQNESEFKSCSWISEQDILGQLEAFKDLNDVKAAKIGIIENPNRLECIIGYLRTHFPGILIVVDPVLRSSTDFDFHQEKDLEVLLKALKNADLITPNALEMKKLMPQHSVEEGALILSEEVQVYLKGGHREEALGYDEIFSEGQAFTLRPRQKKVWEKHGSGCVLSSALTAYLARGFSLQKSCLKAKTYTERFLSSHTGLLGYHNR